MLIDEAGAAVPSGRPERHELERTCAEQALIGSGWQITIDSHPLRELGSLRAFDAVIVLCYPGSQASLELGLFEERGLPILHIGCVGEPGSYRLEGGAGELIFGLGGEICETKRLQRRRFFESTFVRARRRLSRRQLSAFDQAVDAYKLDDDSATRLLTEGLRRIARLEGFREGVGQFARSSFGSAGAWGSLLEELWENDDI